MKAIVLAAGYATRLYPLTENFPKPLLNIGGSTILGRMLNDIDTIESIDEHIIVTNHRFAPIFEQWLQHQSYTKPIHVVDDGTSTNSTRLGAVGDLLLVLRQRNVDDDILLVAADNLLFFTFHDFVRFAKQKGTSCLMCHEQTDVEKLRRTGVITMNDAMRVLNMEEKPQQPQSHWAVPPFYLYTRHDLPLIHHALENGCQNDAPGNLAHYMVSHVDMHAWIMNGGRFDIGSLDTYYQAVERFGH